jgi:hypothetical protein
LIYDTSEWQIEEDEAISKMKTDELDRLVAAGKITETDREQSGSLCAVLFNLLSGPMTLCRPRSGKSLNSELHREAFYF